MRVPIAAIFFSAIFTVALISVLIAFIPTYTAGVDGVDNTINSLRVSIVGKAEAQVRSFFATRAQAMAALMLTEQAGTSNLAAATDHQKVALLCRLALNVGAVSGAYLSQFHHPTRAGYACDVRLGPALGGWSSRTQYFIWQTNSTTYEPITSAAPFLTTPFDPDQWLLRTPVNAVRYQPSWSAPHVGYDSIQYNFHLTINDPNGDPAAFGLTLIPTTIAPLLTQIGLPKRARICVADTASHQMLATSWGEQVQLLLSGWANLNLPDGQRMILRNVSDFNDALINAAIGAAGGEDAILSVATPYSKTFDGPDGKTFLDVVGITDQYSLNLKVILAMPQKDFTEEIDATRNVTIGTVCGVLVAMLLVAVIFAVLLARPLKRLGERMYLTASLRDSGEDDPPSAISEIAEMQDAYVTMKGELTRMKSYLPQSLLEADDDDDEGDRETASGIESALSASMKSSNNDSDTKTVSSSHSRRSSVFAAGKVGGLNMGRGTLHKRVAVASLNLAGFHEVAERAPAVTQIQKAYLAIVNRSVRDNKGIIDVFQGDHVVATFNAVNNVASYSKRAVLAAHTAAAEIAKESTLPKLTCGVSVGPAVVGNMGIPEMTRFNIVGHVYRKASTLQQLATKQLSFMADYITPAPSHCLLIDTATLADVELEFYLQTCGIECLSSKQVEAELVYQVERLKAVATDEWMYQLKEGQDADPFTAINQLYEQYVSSGTTPELKQALDAISDEYIGKHQLIKIIAAVNC